MKKRKNSKQKGKRIELEFVHFLQEQGFHAKRSQQYCGANSDADVEVVELPKFHFEVKGGQQVPAKVYKFMEQAVEDSGIVNASLPEPYKNDLRNPFNDPKVPICVLKRDRQEFLIVMRAEDWIKQNKVPEELLKAFNSPANLQYGLQYLTDKEIKDFNKPIEITKLAQNSLGRVIKGFESLNLKIHKDLHEPENNYGREIVEEREEF